MRNLFKFFERAYYYFRYVASTQFEPMDARFFMPCFDEPEFKAQWQLNVTHPKNTIALSNTKSSCIMTNNG